MSARMRGARRAGAQLSTGMCSAKASERTRARESLARKRPPPSAARPLVLYFYGRQPLALRRQRSMAAATAAKLKLKVRGGGLLIS